MSKGKIPGPYVGDVQQDDGLMVYPPFPKMDIGARTSGLPKEASTGPKSLEHVGGDDGTRGKEGKMPGK
jgi:hypothetical protein